MTDQTTSQAPLSAGAVPELPVVAWRRRYLRPTGLWSYLSAAGSTPPLLNPGLGLQEEEALALHAPAQATIHAQAAEIEHHKQVAEAWKISYLQINSVVITLKAAHAEEVERLKRERDESVAEAKEIRARWNGAENEFAALKAKQVAEVDAVLQAGNPMSNVMFNLAQRPNERITSAECKTFKKLQVKWDAAREDLRAALTKDCT